MYMYLDVTPASMCMYTRSNVRDIVPNFDYSHGTHYQKASTLNLQILLETNTSLVHVSWIDIFHAHDWQSRSMWGGNGGVSSSVQAGLLAYAPGLSKQYGFLRRDNLGLL